MNLIHTAPGNNCIPINAICKVFILVKTPVGVDARYVVYTKEPHYQGNTAKQML